MEIDIKYLIDTIPGNEYHGPKYVIAAPDNVEELEGYGIIISAFSVRKTLHSLVFTRCQEFDKKKNAPVFRFEKIKKVPGKNFPYHKYTNEECQALYDKSDQPNIDMFKEDGDYLLEGTGKIAWCYYFPENNGSIKTSKRWCVLSERYPYFAFMMNGKSKSGYSVIDVNLLEIIKEYYLDDISYVFENMNTLVELIQEKRVEEMLEIVGADINQ